MQLFMMFNVLDKVDFKSVFSFLEFIGSVMGIKIYMFMIL